MEAPERRAVMVWFRQDLRLGDNPALTYAAKQGPVLPVYCVSWQAADPWAPGRAAAWWLARSLAGLAKDLAALGAPLFFLEGDPREALVRLAVECRVTEVVWNRLHEPFARRLEAEVAARLAREGITVRDFPGALLFEPAEHLTRAGKAFTQFGAFWRSCLAASQPEAPLPVPGRLVATEYRGRDEVWPGIVGRRPSVASAEGTPLDLVWEERAVPIVVDAMPWEPGEAGATRRLERFLAEGLEGYARGRDFPAEEAVSRLSPHLHFGEISPRQVWWAVVQAGLVGHRPTTSRSGLPADDAPFEGAGPAGSVKKTAGATGHTDGVAAFLRQLGWREFAHYLLHHFPSTPTDPFRSEFARFPWVQDDQALAAWQQGLTGFPLVDAGMRQLSVEGWMHNRVRMVVASFLTKDLLIPWQVGAAWFWEHLVDADLANNTLGWQWTAGCGPDAAPYFRIYNPELQAKRFDPDGSYVRRWLDNVRGGEGGGHGSVRPIVDHALARARALAAFRGVRGR